LEEQVSKWDINITMGRGPFPELLEHDIVINCIYLLEPIPPFLTMDLINNTPNEKRTLSVVVDVSCDTFMPHNPLPIYSDITTIDSPTTRYIFTNVDVLYSLLLSE
jgi:saccharopine dehydrogenase (NAD+, L-lysine-forming)